MTLPVYQEMIEPTLRFLANQESAVRIRVVRSAVAKALGLTRAVRSRELPSGKNDFQNRVGWAFHRLKSAGLARAPATGLWELTDEGRKYAAEKRSLSSSDIAEIERRGRERRRRNSPEGRRSTKPVRSSATDAKHKGKKAYRLSAQPIATGGQSEVYPAVRKRDSQRFAFKRSLGWSKDKRLSREIRIQKALVHPCIMPIVDWDRDKFRWYVMPLGRRTVAQLGRPLDGADLREILLPVVSALEFAHASGYPHRDVKPHNVIDIGSQGGDPRWVLADWGLTRPPLGQTTSPLTRTGAFLGSEGYAPPEAYVDGHRFGEVGDVYSLGQMIAWALGVDPRRNVTPEVREPFRRLVLAMTDQDPDKRPSSMQQVRERLSPLLP